MSRCHVCGSIETKEEYTNEIFQIDNEPACWYITVKTVTSAQQAGGHCTALQIEQLCTTNWEYTHAVGEERRKIAPRFSFIVNIKQIIFF